MASFHGHDLQSVSCLSFLSRLKSSGRDIAFTLPVHRTPFAVRRPRHISRTVRPTGLKLGDMKGFEFGVRSETFGGVVKVIQGQKVI